MNKSFRMLHPSFWYQNIADIKHSIIIMSKFDTRNIWYREKFVSECSKITYYIGTCYTCVYQFTKDNATRHNWLCMGFY